MPEAFVHLCGQGEGVFGDDVLELELLTTCPLSLSFTPRCSSPSCCSPCAVLVPAVPWSLAACWPSPLVWGAVGVPSSDPSGCPWPCLHLFLMAIAGASMANASYTWALLKTDNGVSSCAAFLQECHQESIRHFSSDESLLEAAPGGEARWVMPSPRTHSVLKPADSIALAFCTTHKCEWKPFVLVCRTQKMQEVSC